MLKNVFYTACILFISTLTFAQQYDYRNYNWYFGNNNRAILFNRFNNEPTLIENQAIPFGIGASSVVSRVPTGELYFYSDGERIYDASHQLMQGNISLQGNTNGNQPSAVSRVPGTVDERRYYVFSNDANGLGAGTIRYVEVDLSQQGNAGGLNQPPLGVVNGPLQSTGITTASEGFIVIDIPFADSVFLLTQNINTFEVELYSIEEVAGNLSATVIDTAALPVNAVASNFSYALNSTADSIYVALSPLNSGFNVQFLTISIADGTLSFNRSVANTGNVDGGAYSVYDAEWKINQFGTYLFFSRHGNAGNTAGVYGIDIQQSNASVEPVVTNLNRSYGLQIGPDGNIYHLSQSIAGGDFELGRVFFTDSIPSNYTYETEPLGDLDFDSRQFPSFAGIQPVNTAALNPVVVGYSTSSHSPSVVGLELDPSAFELSWNINGIPFPNTSGTLTTNVGLNANVNGFFDGNPFSFGGSPTFNECDSVNLGQDTTICLGETLTLDASQLLKNNSGPAINYKWNLPDSTGPNFTTMTVGLQGDYWVAVEFANGCIAYDIINVEVIGDTSQYQNVWYFGDQAGIDFNTNLALTDGATQAPAGVATMSDPFGNVIFYTDGDAVYNSQHVPIFNNLGGNNQAAQSVEIVPFPGDNTLYYIFTTERVDFTGTGGNEINNQRYTLKYAVYDHKRDSVVLNDIPLYHNSTERLAVQNFGNETWILSHEFGSNTFVAYPILQNGIGRPVLSTAGRVHEIADPESGTGSMKFSIDMSRVAVALQEGTDNYVEIFDFDFGTGEVSNPLTVPIPEPGLDVYGVEFSASTNKVFTTLKSGASSKLYEIQIIDSVTFILSEISTFSEELGGMSTGPDGNIYLSSNNQNYVYQFTGGNDSIPITGTSIGQFDLAGRISRLGLPTYTSRTSVSPQDPTFPPPGNACLGQPINVSGTPSSSIDEFEWLFGDGTGIPRPAPTDTTHTYTAVGVYTIELRVTNRCGLDTTLTNDVTVSASPNQPTIPSTASFCDPNVPLILDADSTNTPGLTFLWNTLDTTKTITVPGPGLFGVTITNAAGCISSDTTLVVDGRTPVDLGPDLTVCQNDSLAPFTAGIPNHIYRWFLNGSLTTEVSNQFRYDTSVPNAPNPDQLIVELTDIVTSCISHDTVNIMVNPAPTATTVVSVAPLCGMNNGEITITSDISTYTAVWVDQSGAAITPFSNPQGGLTVGTYTLMLTDNLTGCMNNISVPLVDPTGALGLQASANPGCSDSEIRIEFNPTASFPVDYQIIDTLTSQIVLAGTEASSFDFRVGPVVPGPYWVIVNDQVCNDSAFVNVLQAFPTAIANVVPGPDVRECGSQVNLDVIGDGTNAVYNFIDPLGTVTNNVPISTDIVATENGLYTIEVRADNRCDTTLFVTVLLSPSPIVDIVPEDDGCQGSLTYFSSVQPPNATYSYLWNSSAGQGTGPIYSVNAPGNYSISLLVTDQQTSCQGSVTVPSTVFSNIDVAISVAPLPCENGNEVVLSTQLTPPSTNISYQWFRGGVTLDGETNSSLTTTDEGNFSVTVTRIGTSCVYPGNFSLLRAPSTPSGIDGNYIICNIEPADTTVILDLSQFNSMFYRELISGFSVGPLPGDIVELDEEGVYEFTLINQFDCPTIDTTVVTVDCQPTVFIPSGFRPASGIEENRTLRVFPLYVTDFEIFIYNRWGELVYYSNDLNYMTDVGWDGIVNGKLAMGNTFAYMMRYKSLTNPGKGFFEQRGGVTLVR